MGGSASPVRRLGSGAIGGSHSSMAVHGVTERDMSTASSSELLPAPRQDSSNGQQDQMMAAQNATDDDANPCSAFKLCTRNGNPAMAEELFNAMAKSDLSVEAYNELIHTCTQAGDVERVWWHFKCMREQGFEPTLETFNLVINACAVTGDVAFAEKWLLQMGCAGIKPNHVTYGTVCKVLARQGKVKQIEGIMQAMQDEGMPLNEFFFASLISACGMADPPDLASAECAFTQLVQHGLRPQSVKRALTGVIGKRRSSKLYRDLRKWGNL